MKEEEFNEDQEAFITRLHSAIESAVDTVGFATIAVNGVNVAQVTEAKDDDSNVVPIDKNKLN